MGIELVPGLDSIVQACRDVLKRQYGARFRGLVLYGSVARGQADPGSDIDLLVLLAEPFDYSYELRRIVDLLYPAQLESDRLISAKPAAVGDFEHGRLQLYRNAQHDGRLVA
jgi:predicted nucleotidyltransferase